MRSEELVFDEHSLTEVLCDENESCAIPGHVVVFIGKAIMMKTCYELVSCEQGVMAVNSPKCQRRLRAESNTEGLLYKAFTAGYVIRGKELMLYNLVLDWVLNVEYTVRDREVTFSLFYTVMSLTTKWRLSCYIS